MNSDHTNERGCSGAVKLGDVAKAAVRLRGLQSEPGPREASDQLPSNGAGGFQAAKESWLKVLAAHPNLSGADYAVAITISTYLNTKLGEAWPALETIATATNRDVSTVWRSIERLEGLKLLHVRKGRGRRASNRYRPLVGEISRDPKTLRRGNKNSASSQRKACEFAEGTSEEV
jgi:hypothetical protein